MTTVRIRFTASTGGVVLDGVRHFGAPAEVAKGADFQRREPVVWAAAQEFLREGTEAGVVTVSAT